MRHNRQCKEPCDGCGRTDQYRRKDQICYDCKKILEEAWEIAELKQNPKGKVTVYVPQASHWLKYIRHPGTENDPRGPLHRLALSIGEILPAHPQVEIEELEGKDCSRSSCYAVTMPADALTALREVIASLEECVKAAYKEGHREGRDLLRSLAKGKTTVKQFNNDAMEEEEK